MGQYYKPTNIKNYDWILSHDIKEEYTRDDGMKYTMGQGMKLMEHSYIGNSLMNMVEQLIIPKGKWYKEQLVWAGDYADPEEGTVTEENAEGNNLYDISDDKGHKLDPIKGKVDAKYKWLTNHTKKQLINLEDVKEFEDGWKIHPLPLLLAEGNGRGGGDFHGTDSRIGTWARDIISLEDHPQNGFEIVDGTFKEERNQ